MKDRLRVIAASGEVGEDARIFHTELRAINADPKGREMQDQAMTPTLIFYLSGMSQVLDFLFQGINPCEILWKTERVE
jgi:hypothetical protein